MNNDEYAQRLSQHQVLSAWNDIPLADYERGIGGLTPLEVIHVFCQGLYMDGPKVIHDMLSPSLERGHDNEKGQQAIEGTKGGGSGDKLER